MKFPLILKLHKACKDAHAHSFMAANTEKGLFQALDFEPFKGQDLLIQQAVKHQEKLYKVYTIDSKWAKLVKKSIAESEVHVGDSVFF